MKDVNIVLHKDELLGLLGPNGAGKSTLFNIMSNYFSPSAGLVSYFGHELSRVPRLYDRLGLCAQDDILWADLTVNQHIILF